MTSVSATLRHGARVGAEEPGERRMPAQLRERVDHLRHVGRAPGRRREDVLPRGARPVVVTRASSGSGAARRASRGSGRASRRRDRLRRRATTCPARRAEKRVTRERAEARVVVRVRLDPIREDFRARTAPPRAAMRSPPSARAGSRRSALPHLAVLYSARTVTSRALRNSSHWAIACWMRDHLAQFVDRRARQREQ